MACDRAIATLTIFCEASSEEHVARVGVAASFFNRMHVNPKRYGSTVASVCLHRFQYSEWNQDPADNANLLRGAATSDADPVMTDCAKAYDEAAAGVDPTNGATHFYADGIPEPSWAKVATFTGQIGRIRFYRDVP